MPYRSTKTWGHERGLSCAFRQWRANSHCNKLHGYALSVKLVFEAQYLDERNWVVDFGGLKEVKDWLEQTFDHKTLVAEDDPEFGHFLSLQGSGIIDMVTVQDVGCEAFARMVFDHVTRWLGSDERVRLVSAEVAEHGSNSAIYKEEV